MATYKYQQNFFDGASAGYVKYNISPDFGTPISEGDIIEISGQYYNRYAKTYGIQCNAHYYAADISGAVAVIGFVEQTVSKAKVASFSIKYVVDEKLLKAGIANRKFQSPIDFMLFESSDLSGGTSTMSVAAQELTCLKYRLTPEISNVAFEDTTGAMEYFGCAVQNKSALLLNSISVTDPLDHTTAISKVRVYYNENEWQNSTFSVGEGNQLSIVLGAPKVSGMYNMRLEVEDNKGLSTSVSAGAITIAPYSSPTLITPDGVDIVQRYSTRIDDVGNEIVELSDDGSYVWTSLQAITTAINALNAWELKARWHAEDESDISANEILIASAQDGTEFRIAENQDAIPRIYTFDATKVYYFTFTLSDYFETITVEFTLDKAGGYMNIEKYGVGIGMRTTGKQGTPKFESAYPGYFYAGIHGVTNYSLDEVATGGRWIDGKPIYRRVILMECSKTNTWTLSESIPDIETIIDYRVMSVTTLNLKPVIKNSHYHSTTHTIKTYIEREATDSNTYRFTWWSDYYTGTAICIAEYTKTTDELNYLLDADGNILVDAAGNTFLLK